MLIILAIELSVKLYNLDTNSFLFQVWVKEILREKERRTGKQQGEKRRKQELERRGGVSLIICQRALWSIHFALLVAPSVCITNDALCELAWHSLHVWFAG